MINDTAVFERAQAALADLACATGIAYSATPPVGAISIFSDHRENVYAMKVTGLDAQETSNAASRRTAIRR